MATVLREVDPSVFQPPSGFSAAITTAFIEAHGHTITGNVKAFEETAGKILLSEKTAPHLAKLAASLGDFELVTWYQKNLGREITTTDIRLRIFALRRQASREEVNPTFLNPDLIATWRRKADEWEERLNTA